MKNENTDLIDSLPQEQEQVVVEGAITPFEGDFMDVTCEVAKHLEEYEKALNTIMNFIIKRCYSGDFVSHDRANTPAEDRTVNIVGAAAERIARDMGIQESNRTKPVKKMHEKYPGHYNYECEGDFTFRGRTIHAIGIASTLNPFYRKAAGEERKPEDIREEYIIRDAWRDCTKQGVKGLFGLRKIPLLKLQELGYDISKVKYVNFQTGEKSATAKNPEATAAPVETQKPVAAGDSVTIVISDMAAKVSKTGKPFYSVKDSEGAGLYAWGKAESELIQKLLTAWRDVKPVQVTIKDASGQFPTIVSAV